MFLYMGSYRRCICTLQCTYKKSISPHLYSTSSNSQEKISTLSLNLKLQQHKMLSGWLQLTKSSSGFHLQNLSQDVLLNINQWRNFHIASSSRNQLKKQESGRKPNNAVNEFKLQEATLDVMNSKYRISFVDEGDKDKPVILCLHGMPACHKDFLPILPQLIQGGARVLLFNFPGVGYSWHLEGPPFDYSHLSKAKLVSAFLSHLGIDKVDVLVSHSSSGHAGMELCANTDLMRNVVFICPIAHLPHGQSNRTLMRDVYYYSLKNPSLRAVVGPLLLAVFRKVAQMPIPEVEYFYGLLAESRTWSWNQAREDLKKIQAKDMPVVVLAAKRDPIVQLHISRGVMELVGISPEDKLMYTKEGSWEPAERKGKVNPLKYGVIFEKSSHWVQKAHPDVVAAILLDFLKATQDKKQEK